MQIHQIGGLGFDSNIYLIIDETIALIDAGTGMYSEAIKRNLGKFDIKLGDIELIINTHCHFDHVGGDREFIEASRCGIAIHELEAGALRKGDRELIFPFGDLFGLSSGLKFESIEVSRELREGDEISLGELVLLVIHTPGHSRGGICLYEPERRLLFSGDTVFCGGVGRVDLPTSDGEELVRSLRRLAELDVDKLYPGHGPFAEKNARKYILEAIEYSRFLL